MQPRQAYSARSINGENDFWDGFQTLFWRLVKQIVSMEKKILLLITVLSILFADYADAQNNPVYQDRNADIEERVSDLIGRMTLEEKIQMLNGADANTTFIVGNERLGIPQFTILHGPIGIKAKDSQGKMTVGTYFPVSIAMGATFDDDAVERIGRAMGKEARALGGLYNAGPAMNT